MSESTIISKLKKGIKKKIGRFQRPLSQLDSPCSSPGIRYLSERLHLRTGGVLGRHNWLLHGPQAVILSKCLSRTKSPSSHHSQVRCATIIPTLQRGNGGSEREHVIPGSLLLRKGESAVQCGLSPCAALCCCPVITALSGSEF